MSKCIVECTKCGVPYEDHICPTCGNPCPSLGQFMTGGDCGSIRQLPKAYFLKEEDLKIITESIQRVQDSTLKQAKLLLEQRQIEGVLLDRIQVLEQAVAKLIEDRNTKKEKQTDTRWN